VAAVLLLAFSVLTNVQPAGWEPTHMHVVVGGSDAGKAHALAAHLAQMRLHPETDGRETPAAHAGHTDRSCLDPSDDQPRVLSIHAGDAVALSVFGAGEAPATAAISTLTPPQDPVDRVVAVAVDAATDPPLLLPDPPPRAS
jgi:hypothetical protein